MRRVVPLLIVSVFMLAGCGASKEIDSLCAAVDAKNVDEVKHLLQTGKFDLNADQHTAGGQCRPFPHALSQVRMDVDRPGLEIRLRILDHGADANSWWFLGTTKTLGMSRPIML